MKAKKILFITQEITPYVPQSQMSVTGRELPQYIQETGREIRTFMPKWGIINERRNQLHEVIRLSGMNLIINDTDHPLIIKVASIQAARMQVYFIDNDDYFQRRQMTADENGREYDDNDERGIFYVRGVLETVKKLRWCPEVIHCHGWMSALAPLYIKKAYCDEPSFRDTKIIYSTYGTGFQSAIRKDLGVHATLKGIDENDIKILNSAQNCIDIEKIAIAYSDGLIMNSELAKKELADYARELDIPVLNYQSNEKMFKDACSKFYDDVWGKGKK